MPLRHLYRVHLADGICDAWGEYTEPGKSISPYLFYGYGLVNLQLGRIADAAAKSLEGKGFRSLTFPPTWAISMYRSKGLLPEHYMALIFHTDMLLWLLDWASLGGVV